MRIEAPQFTEPGYYDKLVARKKRLERPDEGVRSFRLPEPTPKELAKYLPPMVLGRWATDGRVTIEKRRGKWYVFVPKKGFRSHCLSLGPILDDLLSGKSTSTKVRL